MGLDGVVHPLLGQLVGVVAVEHLLAPLLVGWVRPNAQVTIGTQRRPAHRANA